MKKILMGTLGMAMAASSFAAVTTPENTTSVPVQATIQLGEMETTTSIKVTGDLNFGTLKPSLDPHGNQNSTALKKTLMVSKVENGKEFPLNLGEYGYKAISRGWTWADAVAGGYVITDDSIDVVDDLFHLDGEGSNVKIGDANINGFPYALRSQGKDGSIDVWFSGDTLVSYS